MSLKIEICIKTVYSWIQNFWIWESKAKVCPQFHTDQISSTHEPHLFSTLLYSKHPSVQHIFKFNTKKPSVQNQRPFSSAHSLVQHTPQWCVELRCVLNWRMWWTEGVLSWGVCWTEGYVELKGELNWSGFGV